MSAFVVLLNDKLASLTILLSHGFFRILPPHVLTYFDYYLYYCCIEIPKTKNHNDVRYGKAVWIGYYFGYDSVRKPNLTVTNSFIF